MPKIVMALIIQLLGLVILMGLVWIAPAWIEPPYSALWLVLVQSGLVLGLTVLWRMNRWWWLIQFALPWLWWVALMFAFDPWVSLVIFVVIILVFANAFSDRVPLYLSNDATRKALRAFVKEKFCFDRPVSFLDIGSGLGGNVVFMSTVTGVQPSHGVETAPIPFALSRLRVAFFRQFVQKKHHPVPLENDLTQASVKNFELSPHIFAKDLWKVSFIEYDLVYAFLSPEPMPKLWEKVVKEMAPGSFFVSNSFPVPGVEPSEIWQLSDRRETVLYLYEMSLFSEEFVK